MFPDNVWQSGDSDVATNFYLWSFSWAALDQGSEDGGNGCVSRFGERARVIFAKDSFTLHRIVAESRGMRGAWNEQQRMQRQGQPQVLRLRRSRWCCERLRSG